ncbi:MAG: type II secretion system protein [Candidatus Paceibacterota bacterium]|jgi:prepilin-type N-terminal cleavage/methylation domain-containing protein
MIKNKQKSKGFTMIETLVSLLIFGIISVILVNVFVSILNSQKRILQNQEIMNQASYTLERLTKIIRMAKNDEAGLCVETTLKNYNWTANSITFLDYNGLCTQFLLEANTIKEKKSSDGNVANLGASQAVTASSVKVDSFGIVVAGDGEDTAQPKVTMTIKMSYNTLFSSPSLVVQTTISQRKLDI